LGAPNTDGAVVVAALVAPNENPPPPNKPPLAVVAVGAELAPTFPNNEPDPALKQIFH